MKSMWRKAPLGGLGAAVLLFSVSAAHADTIQIPGANLLRPGIALRGGGVFTPRGAGLVGFDVALPSLGLGLGDSGKTRLDAEVIFRANLGGANTIVPVTLNQIFQAPNPTGLMRTYFGLGAGAVFGKGTNLAGKLILGADVTQRIGIEFNLNLMRSKPMYAAVARLKF